MINLLSNLLIHIRHGYDTSFIELKIGAFFILNCLTLAMHYEMVAHRRLAVFNSIAFKYLYLLCFDRVNFP